MQGPILPSLVAESELAHPLRLGIVTSGFPFTVKEAFLLPEIQALVDAGAVTCVYPTNPILATPNFANAGASVVRVPLLSPWSFTQMLLECVTNPKRMARALHVIATRGAWRARCKNAAVFVKAVAIARDMRARGLDHVHAYWASTPATIAYIVSVLNEIPWSFSAHRWDIYEDNLLAEKVRTAQFVRAISRRGRAAILERSLGASQKTHVLHLGVAEPHPNGRISSAGREFTLICAANLVPVKGHDVLVRALQLARGRGVPVRCVLAGDGPLRTVLKRSIQDAGLAGSVTISGVIPHDQLLADLSAGVYDAAVLASTEVNDLHEGIPAFLIEAMAAGLPCIATKTGSIEELMDDTVGILVAQKNPGLLSEAIERLARDAELCRQLGAAAHARVAEGFRAERSASELLGWIQADGSAPTRRAMSETTLARS